MAFSENWNGYVACKRQDAKGTQATGSDAIILPMAGGTPGILTKNPIESMLVRRDGMSKRGRHGSRRTSGSYSGEMGIGWFDPLLEAIMRNTWSPADLAVTEADFTSITTGAHSIVWASGNPITEGFRPHDVIRLTNHSSAANNDINLRVTAVSTTTISVAETLVINAVADTDCEITRPGRVLVNSAAGGLTRDYFTIEEYEYDQDSSEVFTDCRWSRFALSMQPDGMLNTEFGWTGTGLFEKLESASAPLFTSPVEPTGDSLCVVEATLRVGSTDIADLTSFNFTQDLQPDAPATIGSSGIAPDVFLGSQLNTLQMTILRQDLADVADFDDETPMTLHLLAAQNENAPSDFFALTVSRFTLGGVAKSALSKRGGARTVTLDVPASLIGKYEESVEGSQTKFQVSNSE